MDVSTVLTIVQTLLQLLDTSISREIESLWGYKSQLKKLRNTMSTIEAVLANVERQQLHISIPQVTLERLKEAVYQADDLFDEVATVANLKELLIMRDNGNKKQAASKEVRLFFSRFNHLRYAFTKSREVKRLREILDDIAKDHRDFGVLLQPPSTSTLMEARNINSSRETYSFLCEQDMIIGRDEEKRIVIDMLLHTAVEENVSVVSIVGMGGLGKTALAKLVYNDDKIQAEFSLKMWVCISDDFDVKSLLMQILAAATNETNNSGLISKDQLQAKLRQKLNGNKYLLVLDDVWNEKSSKWIELRNILIQGGKGSRIIVTTRSKRVADVVGSQLTHELQGLSDDDSWMLFQNVTLMKPHLVEIGKEIARKCFNVPLAIKFMGSFLQGKSEAIWQSLKNTDLAHIEQDGDDGIIPVLKISYNHLPPHLKCCFSYCAVFPKDYKIAKEDLIYQWMAQGFIKPSSNGGLSLEDLGEDYFMKLLQGCFFQDVEQDYKSGVILSCKMHDLVHDLAKEVAGIGNVIFPLHDDKTRHIFIDNTLVEIKDVECYLTKMKNLRTCLVRQSNVASFYVQFPFKMRYLRVLDLSRASSIHGKEDIETLPDMMGELLHLRYLDLSRNAKLLELPNSITQLYNLQTLKLEECSELKGLPRESRKLVNLRHLDIKWCRSLRHMPPGMRSMISLHKLSMFLLGSNNVGSGSLSAGDAGKLEELKYLNNLRGRIEIAFRDGWMYDEEDNKGGYMINKPLLDEIQLSWSFIVNFDLFDAEALLQGLQPHPNLKRLGLKNYPGVAFPGWGQPQFSDLDLNTALPNLVHISLYRCRRLERFPLFTNCVI